MKRRESKLGEMKYLDHRIADMMAAATWPSREHSFGAFAGHLSRRLVKRIDGELRQAGVPARLSTGSDPTIGSYGWFSCWNRGEPFNTRTACETFAVLRARGLWCDEHVNEKGRGVPAGPVGRMPGLRRRRRRPRGSRRPPPRVYFWRELMASLGAVPPSAVRRESRMRDQLWRFDHTDSDSDRISIAHHGQPRVKVWHAPDVDGWEIGRAPGARRPDETRLLVRFLDTGVCDAWWIFCPRSHYTRDRDIRRMTKRRWQIKRRRQMRNRNGARWGQELEAAGGPGSDVALLRRPCRCACR